ncbi:AAA family ATPase [Lewinella sp. LCG006]|uniref:AAA family ATPase n=1 Tax=Lewinella sp. LCG006 TaxID=3231911 RepID=UPI0034615D8A
MKRSNLHLTELGFENFRSFKQITLPLKPLTILIGPNSAGKSSVMKSLLLLRDNYEKNGLSHLEFDEGAKHQLGSFISVANDPDAEIVFNQCFSFIKEKKKASKGTPEERMEVEKENGDSFHQIENTTERGNDFWNSIKRWKVEYRFKGEAGEPENQVKRVTLAGVEITPLSESENNEVNREPLLTYRADSGMVEVTFGSQWIIDLLGDNTALLKLRKDRLKSWVANKIQDRDVNNAVELILSSEEQFSHLEDEDQEEFSDDKFQEDNSSIELESKKEKEEIERLKQEIEKITEEISELETLLSAKVELEEKKSQIETRISDVKRNIKDEEKKVNSLQGILSEEKQSNNLQKEYGLAQDRLSKLQKESNFLLKEKEKFEPSKYQELPKQKNDLENQLKIAVDNLKALESSETRLFQNPKQEQQQQQDRNMEEHDEYKKIKESYGLSSVQDRVTYLSDLIVRWIDSAFAKELKRLLVSNNNESDKIEINNGKIIFNSSLNISELLLLSDKWRLKEYLRGEANESFIDKTLQSLISEEVDSIDKKDLEKVFRDSDSKIADVLISPYLDNIIFDHLTEWLNPLILTLVGSLKLTHFSASRGIQERIYNHSKNRTDLEISLMDWHRFVQANENYKAEKEYQFLMQQFQKDAFDIGIDFNVKIIDGSSLKAIVTTKDGKQRHLADLGFGITQLMPILLQTALHIKTGGLINVEEPGTNLHPSLQSKLAPFFLQAIDQGVQFILETHSEYFIRALQAEGGKIDKVGILYLKEGRLEKEISIIEKGELNTPFPEGFYDERERLVFKKELLPDLAGKRILVLTEDEKWNDSKCLECLLESNMFRMSEVLIKSFKGKTKAHFAAGMAKIILEEITHIKKVIIHLDSDGVGKQFVIEDTFKDNKEYFRDVEVFVTEYNDIEGYFLRESHISNLGLSESGMEELRDKINQEEQRTRDNKISALTQKYSSEEAARNQYNSSPEKFRFSKKILGVVKSHLKSKNINIIQRTDGLKCNFLSGLANEVWRETQNIKQ